MITLLVTLVILGVIAWAIQSYVPMDASVKKIVTAVVVILAILLVLQAFGIVHGIPRLR